MQPPTLGLRAATLLHLVLTIGLAVLVGVGAVIPRLLGGPFLGATPEAAMMDYALGGAGLLGVIIGAFVLRPRVRHRSSGETRDGFWAEPAILHSAVLVWVVLEGGATIGVVGYMLSGGMVAASAAGAGLASLLIFAPGRLEGDASSAP